MKFRPRPRPLLVARVPAHSYFVAGVRISRRALSLLADSSGLDGYFVLHVRSPFAKDQPEAMFLLFDNMRAGSLPGQVVALVQEFSAFAARAACVPLVFTVNHARRRVLYDQQVLTIQVPHNEVPYPWDLLESLVLIYAENHAAAAKIFKEQL